MTAGIVTERGVEWKSSACILCECNCGILVKLGVASITIRTAEVSASSTRSGAAQTAHRPF